MSTDTLTQNGKSERVNIAGCWIMTSYNKTGLCRVETGMLDWCEAGSPTFYCIVMLHFYYILKPIVLWSTDSSFALCTIVTSCIVKN